MTIVTIGKLICYLLVLQDLIFGSRNKVEDQALKVALIRIREYTDKKLYATTTPKLKVQVNNKILVYAMLDTRAEINVITSKVAKVARLAICINLRLTLVSHTSNRRQFDRICKDVEIDIGRIKTYKPIFVVTSIDHKLILGQPYIFSSKLTISAKDDSMYTTIPSADKSKTIQIWVIKLEDTRNQVEKDIF